VSYSNQSNNPLLNNSYILILVVLHPYTISNVNDVTTAVCDGRNGDDGVNRLVSGLARVQVDHHRRPLCRFLPAWSSHVHACKLLYFLEIFAVLNTLIDYFGYFKLFLYAPQRRRQYYWNTHGGVLSCSKKSCPIVMKHVENVYQLPNSAKFDYQSNRSD